MNLKAFQKSREMLLTTITQGLFQDERVVAAWLLGVYVLGIEPVYAWGNMVRYTTTNHVITGIIKAFIYGALIATISCYKGLNCGEGAEGVGTATTKAVVYSSITVLVCNFFLTMFLNNVLPSS